MFTLYLLCLLVLLLAGGLYVCYRVVRYTLVRLGAAMPWSMPDHGWRLSPAAANSLATGSASMPVAESASPSTRRAMLDSLTLRAVLVGVLALLMLIPLAFVNDIVTERGYRFQTVLDDIARTWGSRQILMAPVLVVPFVEARTVQETVIDANGTSRLVSKQVRTAKLARFLPSDLDISVAMENEFRKRGIFESLVYTAEVAVKARFDRLDVDSLSGDVKTIAWDKAWLTVGISDTRAIREVSRFEWNESTQVLAPGTRLDEIPLGFHARLPVINESGGYTVDIVMSVAGSGAFDFAPLGETTRVAIRSSWPHPSFQGDALPESFSVTDDGFNAQWEVPHLARNYPQAWAGTAQSVNLNEFIAGVSMFEPVSLYSQITRAVKYGILFIALTFLTLLCFEVAIERRMHVVQYIMVGISLCLFFLVLLSLSEHVAFVQAYVGAAALTIAMIAVYTGSVLRSVGRALVVTALLASLYAVLYSLLQLEDYALLVGTALLVLVVMALMILTRSLPEGVAGSAAMAPMQAE